MLARYSGAGLMAAVITTALLFLMQMLVAQGTFKLVPPHGIVLKDIFWEGDPLPDPIRNRRKKPEKPEIESKPLPDKPVATIAGPGDGLIIEREFRPETAAPPIGPDIAAFVDRGAYPRFRVPHQFPRRAQTSGCVVYGFTVTKTGGTRDIHVIDSSARMFDREGEKAIAQYRYEPLIVNGRPFEAPMQSIRLVWEMEGEALPDHSACR